MNSKALQQELKGFGLQDSIEIAIPNLWQRSFSYCQERNLAEMTTHLGGQLLMLKGSIDILLGILIDDSSGRGHPSRMASPIMHRRKTNEDVG